MSDLSDRRWPRLLLPVLGLAAGLGITEVALRVLDYQPGRLGLFVAGEGTHLVQPDLAIDTRVYDADVRLVTNAHGMRGPATTVQGDGRTRVALLGDSFAFGLWATRTETTFAAVLEQRLDGVEVLNFGVPGYGFTDMRLRLEQDVLAFRPDHVLIVSYNGNDVVDTFLGQGRYSVARDGTLRRELQPIVDAIPEPWYSADRARDPRGVWDWATVKLLRSAGRAIWRRPPPPVSDEPPMITWGIGHFWSQSEPPPLVADATAHALRELDRVRALCDEAGVGLAVAALPYLDQVERPGLFAGAELDIDLPQRHIADWARGNGTPYLDLRPPLAAADGTLYWVGEGHLTDAGHAVVGAALAPFVDGLVSAPQ